MRKIILFIGVFFITLQLMDAQIIFTDDTTICSTQPFTLAAFSSDPLLEFSSDDKFTPVLEIGFSFEFYGNTYDKLIINSNGFLTFDTTNASVANGFWTISTPMPAWNLDDTIWNAIMTPWHDTDPNIGGNVYFGSYGVAPNRVYIVTFCALPMYLTSCNSLISTSQVLLYEGSNKIEMNIQEKPICLAQLLIP